MNKLPIFAEKKTMITACMALLIVFIVFAYQGSLDSPFLFDDIPNIVLNPLIHPTSSEQLPQSLQPVQGLSYRPLASLTFAVNYLLGESDVYGYHLLNICIHLLNALLLFILLIKISRTVVEPIDGSAENGAIRLAFWGAILWALHPVQVHAVTYIVQRMTSLATLFYLLGLLSFLYYRAGALSAKWCWPLIAICFAAGMACKEIIITLPIALVLIDRLLPGGQRHINGRLIAGLLVLVVSVSIYYLYGHLHSLTQTYPGRDFSGVERLMTQARVLWHYLSLLSWPMPGRLHMDYEFPVSRSLLEPWTTLLSITLLFVVTLAVVALRKEKPLFVLGWLFFLLALSVESSFLNLEMVYIHRLYLPGLFLFVGILSLLNSLQIKRLALLLWVLVALLTFATLQRNMEWNSRAAFWNVDYQRGASAYRAILNHANGLLVANNAAEAIPLLEELLSVTEPERRLQLLNSLGIARFHSGDYEGAIRAFDLLEKGFGALQESLYYAAQAHARLGNIEMLKETATRLIDYNAASTYGHLLLTEYQRRTAGPLIALNALQAFIQRHPGLTTDHANDCHLYMADIYLELGESQKAYDLYNEVIAKDPHQFLAWIQIYRMLKSSGDDQGLQKIRAYLESKHVRIPEE